MEIRQRRTTDVGDINESENEYDARHGEEEVTTKDAANEILLKAIARMGAKAKMDIPFYEGNLDVEEHLDWIRALDTYFDYEDVEQDKKVKHAVMRLKGHAGTSLTSVQRKRKKLEKLTSPKHRGDMWRRKMLKAEDH
jgi:hypothetical protein